MNIQSIYEQTSKISDDLYQNSAKSFQEFPVYFKQLALFFESETDLLRQDKSVYNIIEQLISAYQEQNVLRIADILRHDITKILVSYAKRIGCPIINMVDIHPEKEEGKSKNIQSEKILERNLQSVVLQDGEIYSSFSDIVRAETTYAQTVSIDELGCIRVMTQTGWRQINSAYDSKYAAKKWAEQIGNLEEYHTVLICGMSDGEHIRQVLDNVGEKTPIVIYEPNKDIFMINILQTDLSDILKRKNCYLFIEGINDSYIQDYILNLFTVSTFGFSKIYALPGYDVIYSEKIQKFIDKCRKGFESIEINHNTAILSNEVTNYNMIMNLKYIMNGSIIDELKRVFTKRKILDLPVIIVGAGPSLDKNIAELKNAKGKSVIIATDSSLRMLMNNEILPDFLITLDPNKERILFEDDRIKNIPMLYHIHATHDVIGNNCSKKFVYSNMDFLDDILKRMSKQISFINQGGSVSCSGFAVAQFLGFKTIIMIGQDLAFTQNKKHASIVYEEMEINEQEKDVYTTIEGIDGNPILTYLNFKVYRDWYENEIEKDTTLTVINATEGGALIHGAKNLTLQQAIADYCHREVDLSDVVNECCDTFTSEEKKAFKTCVGDYIEECNELMKSIMLCSDEYTKLTGQLSETELRESLKKIDQLTQKISSYAVSEFMLYYSTQEEDVIMNDFYQGTEELEQKQILADTADKGKRLMKVYSKNALKTKDLILKCYQEL